MEHEQGNEGDSDARSRDEGAAIIEDEPASDFYASLVGLNPSAASWKRRRILPPPNKSDNTAPLLEADSTTSSSHIVDAKKGEIQAMILILLEHRNQKWPKHFTEHLPIQRNRHPYRSTSPTKDMLC